MESGLVHQFGKLCSKLSSFEKNTSSELGLLNDLMATHFPGLCIAMEGCLLSVENRMSAGAYSEGVKNMKNLVDPCLILLRGLRDLVFGSRNHTCRLQLREILNKRYFACHIMNAKAWEDRMDDLTWYGQFLLQTREQLPFDRKLLIIRSMYDQDDSNLMMPPIKVNRLNLLEKSVKEVCRIGDFKKRLNIKFEHEVAGGFGVVKEWLHMVSKEVFGRKLGLFEACGPSQRVRLLPLKERPSRSNRSYYKFAGILVSLAIKYNIPIGLRLDGAFYWPLQGKGHTDNDLLDLEDIKETDEALYETYKKLLGMTYEEIANLDMNFVAYDGTSLCEGGSEKAVNVENRELYVRMSISYRFVESIHDEFLDFLVGFGEVLHDQTPNHQGLRPLGVFQCLTLADLDKLLGEGTTLSVEEWKRNTAYIGGYRETDIQISWFWELVREMSGEKRRNLLFFWICIRYLPVDGFAGLSSSPTLCKSEESGKLPYARTCFATLYMPAYVSKEEMNNDLDIIMQEFASESFGLE